MFWHGGSSYAMFDLSDPSHAETFSSMEAAKAEFASRANDRFYPCVDRVSPDDGGPSAWVFLGEVSDYPDRVMSFGPRGGVRVDRA